MPKQIESLDVSANTIDEAIEQGLAQLGLSRDVVDIEVIREGKRGVFGIGAEKAQVRLTPRGKERKAPERPAPSSRAEPRKAEPAPVKPEPAPLKAEPAPVVEEVADVEEEEAEFPLPDTAEELPAVPAAALTAEQAELAKTGAAYLDGLLNHMGIKARVTFRLGPDLVEPGEEVPLVLDVTGDDLGILIGRRSDTLQALQYMVRLMVSKQTSNWESIVVDVESYRVRRRRSLRQMAEKMAERAAVSGKRVILEAMPAHERRIIHLTLKDHPQVMTKSVGTDDNRKVTIIPK